MVVRRPAGDRRGPPRAGARPRSAPGEAHTRRRLRDRLQPAGPRATRARDGHRPRTGGDRLLPGTRRARAARAPSRPSLPGRRLRRRHVVRRDLPRLGERRPRGGRGDGARGAPGGPAPRARARAAWRSGAPTTRRCSRATATRAASSWRSSSGADSGSSGPATATRSSSRCSWRDGRSTACSAARAPTWASCPRPLEWAFKRALLAEAGLVRRGLSFPVGASVVALARK